MILWLTVYAICMANVEASLVVHLRTIYYPGNPVEIFPLSLLSHRDLFIELFRELATILMIFSVAVLSVREKHRQFGAFLFVFGLWDLFYYLWLKIIIGWPVRWLEWDVLFLIPWPWLAPWITAALNVWSGFGLVDSGNPDQPDIPAAACMALAGEWRSGLSRVYAKGISLGTICFRLLAYGSRIVDGYSGEYVAGMTGECLQ